MRNDSAGVRQPIYVDGSASQCVITIQFTADPAPDLGESMDENVGHGKLLLKVNEAAERLSLSRTHLYEYLTSGELESFKIGRSRLIPTDALEAFVNRYRHEQQHIT